MAVTLGSTGITFPDATTQTTAATGGVTSLNGQTGAITNTTLYAIGSYIQGRPQDTTYYAENSTIAGSSLYNSGNLRWSGSVWFVVSSASSPSVNPSLINTGTWRCTSPCMIATGVSYQSGIWVRIS
jgi:hypothetical protein